MTMSSEQQLSMLTDLLLFFQWVCYRFKDLKVDNVFPSIFLIFWFKICISNRDLIYVSDEYSCCLNLQKSFTPQNNLKHQIIMEKFSLKVFTNMSLSFGITAKSGLTTLKQPSFPFVMELNSNSSAL